MSTKPKYFVAGWSKFLKYDLAVGTKVNVETDESIELGTVVAHYTANEKEQLQVSFSYNGSWYILPFSRKTGKIYGRSLHKDNFKLL
jgi:hypothetical protein